MAMTVIVTRNAPDRMRGFLASCSCEISPGVYTAPRMCKAVRERVWSVIEHWYGLVDDCSVTMTWIDRESPGN